MSAQWGKPQRNPRSAWAPEKRLNKYVDGHKTVFAKYNEMQLKGRVADAMKLFVEAAVKERKRQLLLPEPEYQIDRFAIIKEKLGGEEGVIKLAAEWAQLAEDARKQANKDSGSSDVLNMFSMDFIEACELGNVAKVVALLGIGKGDVNAFLGDDPIFLYLFNKVPLPVHTIFNYIILAFLVQILQIDVLYLPDEIELVVLADADMKISKKMSKRLDKRTSLLSNFSVRQRTR